MSNDDVNGKVKGDLISREATLNLWCANCIVMRIGNGCNRPCRDIERIKAIPAADAVPVVRGRWVEVRNKHNEKVGEKCSVCGRRVRNCGENYCPTCGAKMDKEAN